MMPVDEAPDHMIAKVRGTQPEFMGTTRRRKTATRSRSRLVPMAVRGQMMGMERMVVRTMAQSDILSSSSW